MLEIIDWIRIEHRLMMDLLTNADLRLKDKFWQIYTGNPVSSKIRLTSQWFRNGGRD